MARIDEDKKIESRLQHTSINSMYEEYREAARLAKIAKDKYNSLTAASPEEKEKARQEYKRLQWDADNKYNMYSYASEAKRKLNDTEESEGEEGTISTRPSASFYRDLGAVMSGRPTGNQMDYESEKEIATSRNAGREAAIHGMETQQHAQRANRNEYIEAGKKAANKNDSENRQTIANVGYGSGTAAARLRKTNTPDIQTEVGVQNEQLSQAETMRQKQLNAQAVSDNARIESDQWKLKSRDYDTDYNMEDWLSKPDSIQWKDKTNTNRFSINRAGKIKEQPTATPVEKPVKQEGDNAQLQNIINKVLGDPTRRKYQVINKPVTITDNNGNTFKFDSPVVDYVLDISLDNKGNVLSSKESTVPRLSYSGLDDAGNTIAIQWSGSPATWTQEDENKLNGLLKKYPDLNPRNNEYTTRMRYNENKGQYENIKVVDTDKYTNRINNNYRGGNKGTGEFLSTYFDKPIMRIEELKKLKAKENEAEKEAEKPKPSINNVSADNAAAAGSFDIKQYACGTDSAEPGYALVGEEGPELVMMNGGEEVIPSEETMQVLSDIRCKYIKELLDNDVDMDPEDFMFLAKMQGGKYNHNGKEYDFFNDDDWNNDDSESVLDGYADYIRNYLYTYKPEATEIDSSIDPEEEHIGPMAQDIEKVNPACIKETSDGVKTVDTARLAMMNAGAIGDLARQIRELKEALNG